MKTKRISAIFLSAAMCMGLAGCKSEKIPTPEELLMDSGLSEVASIDADIGIKLDSKIPMGDLISGGEGSMNMGIDAKLNLSGTKELLKLTGDIGINMFGMDYTEAMTSYVVTATDGTVTTYSLDNESGLWTYTTEAASDSTQLTTLASLDPSMFENLTLQPVEKNDTVYTVTGDIVLADFVDETGMDANDVLSMEGLSSNVFEDGKFNANLTYARDTKQLTAVTLTLDPSTVPSEEMEIGEFAVSIHINSVNDCEVEIPDDVLQNAVDASSIIEWDWEEGYDESFGGYDNDEDYSYDEYIYEMNEGEPEIAVVAPKEAP